MYVIGCVYRNVVHMPVWRLELDAGNLPQLFSTS